VQTGPDRTGPDRTGPDRTGPDRTGPDTGPDRTGPDRTGPDRTGPDRTGHPLKQLNNYFGSEGNEKLPPRKILAVGIVQKAPSTPNTTNPHYITLHLKKLGEC